MEPIKLAEFDEKKLAHAELARVLEAGTHPHAECREDPNAPLPFQVWSGPATK